MYVLYVLKNAFMLSTHAYIRSWTIKEEMYVGHEFLEGSSNIVRGRTVPWNTLAIWKVDYLSLTGFPLIGDGTAEARNIGGVEVSISIS